MPRTSRPDAGSALFRQALADVADGIRSAAEGDLRDLLVKSRLPMPLFNPSLYDRDDAFIARPDAWWPEFGVAVEVDSHEWHMSPDDHARTLARGRRVGKHQVIVLRFTPRQIRSGPAQVIKEIWEALEGARGRLPLNLRTVPADVGQPAKNPGQPAKNPGQPAKNPGQPAKNPGQPAKNPVSPAGGSHSGRVRHRW